MSYRADWLNDVVGSGHSNTYWNVCYDDLVDHDDLHIMFKALGDPTRLRIYNFLRDCCCPVAVGEGGEVRPVVGPTAGEVCCHVTGSATITSNVSFHLQELRKAGLVTTERRGKHMVCGVDPAGLARLAGYFADQGGCCSSRPKEKEKV